MKPLWWLPVAVFIGVSVPLVLLLNALQLGGDYKVWIALAAGALATALVQSRTGRREDKQQ